MRSRYFCLGGFDETVDTMCMYEVRGGGFWRMRPSVNHLIGQYPRVLREDLIPDAEIMTSYLITPMPSVDRIGSIYESPTSHM
jgi:hypothetical protein